MQSHAYSILPKCLAAAVGGLISVSANALCDDGTSNCSTFTVVGVRPWNVDIIFAMNTMLTPIQFASAQNAFKRTVVSEDFQEWRQEVAAAWFNRSTTNDVRCNISATQTTRNTTSHDDPTNRYLAAQQLFTAISAVDNGISLAKVIAGSRPALFEGKYVATFTVIYADNTEEKFRVKPGVP